MFGQICGIVHRANSLAERVVVLHDDEIVNGHVVFVGGFPRLRENDREGRVWTHPMVIIPEEVYAPILLGVYCKSHFNSTRKVQATTIKT